MDNGRRDSYEGTDKKNPIVLILVVVDNGRREDQETAKDQLEES